MILKVSQKKNFDPECKKCFELVFTFNFFCFAYLSCVEIASSKNEDSKSNTRFKKISKIIKVLDTQSFKIIFVASNQLRNRNLIVYQYLFSFIFES